MPLIIVCFLVLSRSSLEFPNNFASERNIIYNCLCSYIIAGLLKQKFWIPFPLSRKRRRKRRLQLFAVGISLAKAIRNRRWATRLCGSVAASAFCAVRQLYHVTEGGGERKEDEPNGIFPP